MENDPNSQMQSNINQNDVPSQPIKNGGKAPIIAIIVVIIIAITGIGLTWYFVNNNANKKAQEKETKINELTVKLEVLNAEITELKESQTAPSSGNDQEAALSSIKAIYEYWIDGKGKDIDYLLKNNLITPALVEQYNSGLSYDLISCSQNDLGKSSNYTFGLPTVTTPTTASMQVSGEYLGAGTPTTLIINLDMTKDGQVWKLNKVSCPKI